MRALSRLNIRSAQNLRHPLLLTPPRSFSSFREATQSFKSNVSRLSVGTISTVFFGVGGVSWIMFDRLYLEPLREKKVKKTMVEMDEARNFEQFLSGDHIPDADAYYAIERKEKEELLKSDIMKSARIPQVVNVVGPKELGKSYLLKKVAKQISAPYKVFYLDGSRTLREYLKIEYQWHFPSERDVISELFQAIKKYKKANRKEKIIVILDSPGGITEPEDSGKTTDKTLDFLIKSMKTSVANSEATFYCISSKPKNIFTQQRVRVFGDSRFEQIEGEQWIDLSLSMEEMVCLIKQYEQGSNIKFNEKVRTELLSCTESKIGVFIKLIAKLN